MRRRVRAAAATAIVLSIGFAACRSGSAASKCGAVEALVEPSEGHVLPPVTVPYVHHPPTSGRHWHTPPAPGVHDQPVAEESQIAALERGWVILQYGRAATAKDRRTLTRFAGPEVVVAPATRIDGGQPVAFTAWQHRQRCDRVDGAAVRKFLDRYKGKPVT